MKTIHRWIAYGKRYADRWWYAPVLGLLAALDSFVVVVPTDGLVVSAAMLAPRRWIYTTVVVAIGSSIGAWAFALLIQSHGLPWLLHFQPGIDQSSTWLYADKLFDSWGAWAVLLISVTPIMQQPVIALAAIAGMPMTKIFLISAAGRCVKYGVLTYLGTHAPGLLGKVWGLDKELDEVGVPHNSETKKSNP